MEKMSEVAQKGFNAARGFVGGAAEDNHRSSRPRKGFQCRTRLCGWCSADEFIHALNYTPFQCRTRLCGWCSSGAALVIGGAFIVSMPHAALWVVQQLFVGYFLFIEMGFNAARGFVGGAATSPLPHDRFINKFQCRTRLCGWCSLVRELDLDSRFCCFNAARGFVGGAARRRRRRCCNRCCVSMPHAALWVVQPCNGRNDR